jgi:tetratricopeptide (TPR) repeat protein
MLKQSRDALDENDAQAALEFADKALAFRKVPKAYVARAQALERLGRIDEAIDAIDLAIDIGKRSGTEYAAGWATRGRILWNARRKDEARAAFLHYLELDDKDTAKVRKFLDEPR